MKRKSVDVSSFFSKKRCKDQVDYGEFTNELNIHNTIASKHSIISQIQSQSNFIQNFPVGHAPRPPSISMPRRLILAQYVAIKTSLNSVMWPCQI